MKNKVRSLSTVPNRLCLAFGIFMLMAASPSLAAQMGSGPVFLAPAIGVEVIGKRDMNSKTVYLGNNTYKWTGSTGPLHYEDNQKKWQNIDTALRPSTDKDYDLENVTNNYKTYFKEDITRPQAVKYRIGESSMIIEAVDHAWGRLQVTHGQAIGSQFVYPESYQGIDIRYTISAQWLFEEYVVKTRARALDIESISQRIILQNAILDEQPDGSVWFRDVKTQAVLWKFPRPFMFEDKAKDEKNFDLHYVIVKEAENVYLLTKVLDPAGRAWLLSKDRQYPVVIDDTATLNDPTEDGVAVDDGGGDYHIDNSSTSIYMRSSMGLGKRGYVEWNITSIPDSATISNVLFKYHGKTAGTSTVRRIVALTAAQPTTRNAAVLSGDIAAGSDYVNPWGLVAAAAQTQDLGTTADTDLVNKLVGNWFAIGFNNQNADQCSIYSEEYGSVNPAPTLEVTYSPGAPAGWGHKVMGVTSVSKVNNVPLASIKSIMGVQ